MFAWSSEQQYTQQPARQPQELQQQQDGQGDNTAAAEWPAVLRTGAVVLAMQGPVEMELLIAQVWLCVCCCTHQMWVVTPLADVLGRLPRLNSPLLQVYAHIQWITDAQFILVVLRT